VEKEDYFKLGADITDGEIFSVKNKNSLRVLLKILGKNVHAHGRGFPFPEACGLFAKKSVYTPHNDLIGSQGWTAAIRRFLFNRYDFITTQTEYGKKKFIEQGIKQDKVVVMPTPVDHSFFSKESKKDCDAFRKEYGLGDEVFALAVGIRPLKNPIVIAEACKKVGIRVVMLGSRRADELENAWGLEKGFEWFLPPKELEEIENVVLTGQLKPEQVRAAFNAASVFVNSSDYECFGLVAYEAASAGIPLCLPSYGSFDNFKDCALFHQCRDVNQLAKNIKRYLENSELTKKNAHGAREVAKKFDYPITHNKWKEFYRKMKVKS